MNNTEFLKEVRSRFGVENYTGLKRFLGLSNGYLSRFEKGKINDPNKLLFVLASKGFNIELKIKKGSSIFITVPPDENTANNNHIEKSFNRPNHKKFLHEKVYKETSPNSTQKGSSGIPFVFEGDKEFDDGIVITVLDDNPVSSGHGSDIGEKEASDTIYSHPQGACEVSPSYEPASQGDSMNPTLNDGDMMVCDGGSWDGVGVYE